MNKKEHLKAHQRIGLWLKENRLKAGMTQEQVAALIGRHKTFVSKYEAGRRLDLGMLNKISRAVKANLHEVVGLAGKG
jgi:transcriptional regulator with XRE-family HTH domain